MFLRILIFLFKMFRTKLISVILLIYKIIIRNIPIWIKYIDASILLNVCAHYVS